MQNKVMEHLINKDALVAEIKRRIEAHKETLKNCDSNISEMVLKGSMNAYQSLLHFLDTLEENNSTHRTPADIESAMQEVEEKSEAYTNAHRGERDDDVLSQMRGEYVSEDLEKAANDYGVNIRKGYPRVMDEIDKYIYDAFKAGAQWQRDQILNCNATLLRTFELGKIEMKHQILKAMDLGEPPYLISVEKAYYDVKKLLEDEV